MPRDPNGKLYKRKLRDPYWEGRDRADLRRAALSRRHQAARSAMAGSMGLMRPTASPSGSSTTA